MFYKLLKIPAGFAIRIYCRNISVNNKKIFEAKGPILIASNHPDSFLDAIIMATLFKRPVYSLTRGDTFKNKFFAAMLSALNMLPVYRISEGAENLEQNYETFEKCKKIFRNNGIVLIFSEGRCINEWKLRPLKKGTARLASSSWQNGIDLTIIPAGINYQSFTSFGKNVEINFGRPVSNTDINAANSYGNTINNFNEKLRQELKKVVIEIDSNNKQAIQNRFKIKQAFLKKLLLFLPAVCGYLLHALLYIPVQKFAWRKAGHIDHYDSVLVGMLFLLYPLYLIVIAMLMYWLTGGFWWILVFAVLPFCAWAFVQVKRQF